MKTKVVGLFMATLLALSMVGVGYAYWTDVLYIDGSVTTGTFWGYISLDDAYDVEDKDVGDVSAMLVDYQFEADDLEYAKGLEVSITDAYPGYVAHLHWDIHWMGSVPAHVTVTGLETLPDWLEVSVYVMSTSPGDDPDWEAYWGPNQAIPLAGGIDEFVTLMEASQWHYCHDVHFCFMFEVIEDDAAGIDPPQDAEVTFGMDFNFYQYNAAP